METDIGITVANRQVVAQKLGKMLADETILYVKTKNAHWNMEGADFYDKHIFFEKQFIQLDALIDSVAEQIRSLDHYAPASLKSYLHLTDLTDKLDEDNSSESFIRELLQDHESIILNLRKHITVFADDAQDIGSSDFITRLMQNHERMAWFLRSHLKIPNDVL